MHPPIFVRELGRRGARPARRRLAFPKRVHRAACPDRAAERRRAPAAGHCAGLVLRGADRAQRHPCLQRPGLAALTAGSPRPKSAAPVLDGARLERLRALLHQPRATSASRGLWTLALAAEVAHAQGLTRPAGQDETIRQALKRLGVGWKRAKTLDHQPRPGVRCEKKAPRPPDPPGRAPPGLGARLPGRGLVEPAGPAGAARLGRRRAAAAGTSRPPTRRPRPEGAGLLRAAAGPTPAGCCCGSSTGRPVSQVTEDFLAWACERLAAEGKRALLLVWDNAAWHVSRRVRAWIKAHNRRAKAEGGVRIVACLLPARARGSTRSSRSGSTASGRSSSRSGS